MIRAANPYPPAMPTALLLLLAAYLVGAVPFGYLIGRLRGVDLFEEGSGNIGATNAGRVLGRKFGVLVFVLDFLKGVVPVAVIVPLAEALAPGAGSAFGPPDTLRVGAAALAFLGHLFPVYLGFRGGKGIATGAGTVFVLAPGPATLAVLAWVVVLFATQLASLASLSAVVALVAARLAGEPPAFSTDALPVTLYLLAGTALVFVKHHGNIRRLAAGTENRIGDFPMRQPVVRALHVLALGLWFGGAAFFNFAAAPAIFASFREVVNAGPSDRTAYQRIIDPAAPQAEKDALASALAGSAVGPVFPKYFATQAACGLVALVTAWGWRNAEGRRRVHRLRLWVIALAWLTVVIGWPISNEVSELRLLRFSPDRGTADAAKALFGPWHLASLLLSFVTVCLAGIALALAGRLPQQERTE